MFVVHRVLLAAGVMAVMALVTSCDATSDALRSRSGSVGGVGADEMQLLLQRLDRLEAENAKLRDLTRGLVGHRADGVEDGEDTAAGLPSFHHRPTDGAKDDGRTANTLFVEMADGGQAKVMETEKEDPTIECQTVCKFVRPNSASKLNTGQDAQSAMLGQSGAAEAE